MIGLADPELGTLELSCENGYVVTDFQLGSPAVREVVHERALSDGTVDDTLYVGARAVTLTIVLDTNVAPMQTLLDQLTPYVSPRRRPVLLWTLPGSDTERRALIVRGVDAPFLFDRPKFPALSVSWVAPDGLIVAPEQTCEPFTPSVDVVDGRTYDQCALVPSPDRVEAATTTGRCYDRVYPPAVTRGAVRITNHGTEVADFTCALYGPVVTPELEVNGVLVTLGASQPGSVELGLGESVVIDTRWRTILRDGDPTRSVYGLSNYTEWSWDQLRLRPGVNEVRYTGTLMTEETSAIICWRSTWR